MRLTNGIRSSMAQHLIAKLLKDQQKEANHLAKNLVDKAIPLYVEFYGDGKSFYDYAALPIKWKKKQDSLFIKVPGKGMNTYIRTNSGYYLPCDFIDLGAMIKEIQKEPQLQKYYKKVLGIIELTYEYTDVKNALRTKENKLKREIDIVLSKFNTSKQFLESGLDIAKDFPESFFEEEETKKVDEKEVNDKIGEIIAT